MTSPMLLAPDLDGGRWFLLAPRPGWRQSAMLSQDVQLTEARLRLANAVAPPTIFDCAPPACVALPCCEWAVRDAACRRVLIVTGTGQVRLVLGPLAWTADGGARPVAHRCVPDASGCRFAPVWEERTWQPAGVIEVDGAAGVVDTANRVVHVFDRAGHWVRASDGTDLPGCPWPAATPRYQRSGDFVTVGLDSGRPGCEWHRVALSGTTPMGSRVTVSTLTTDGDLTEGEVATLDEDRWVTAGTYSDPSRSQWDALVASPPGRYLWLALALASDGAVTPTIDDIEVHFPRQTSLRFLPAVYRTGADGGSFMDRFLALTDTVRGSVTGEIDQLAWQLDPRAADAAPQHDFLDWLGRWIGMIDTETLPTARRRRLIGAAAELYRRHGTPDGVSRHVALWLGRRVQVLEYYRLRRWAVVDHGRLGDATRLFGADIVQRLQLDEHAQIGAFRLVDTPSPRTDPFAVSAHRFTLFVHACPDDDPEQLAARASRVVAAVQPGHCVSGVAIVLPRMRVGAQASLGLDSVVGGAPSPAQLGGRRLREGLTVGREPRRGDRPGIGIDARIGTRAAIV
jgi:phage tail-like protein